MQGVIRFEFSKLGNAVDHVVYRQQLTRLGGATGKKRIGELDRETLAYPPYFSNYLQYNLNGEEFSNYEDVKTGSENIVTQNERTKGF